MVLVVSELVTNAVRHGGCSYALRLAARAGGGEVTVGDPSLGRPTWSRG
ncbi:hypothetical protein [Streptomyces sp. NPDC001568]